MSTPNFLEDLQVSKYGPDTMDQTRLYLHAYEYIFGDRVPTKAGLCRVLQVSKNTLYRWCELHIEFRELVDQMTLEKERQLLNKGLVSIFNSNLTKLALVEHGYADKSVVDFNGDIKELSNEQLEYILKHGHLPSPI